MRRLLRRALEIGHPRSASSATAWKPAWSRPGTTPRTSRAELVTSKPPPSLGSSETVAVTSSRSCGRPAARPATPRSPGTCRSRCSRTPARRSPPRANPPTERAPAVRRSPSWLLSSRCSRRANPRTRSLANSSHAFRTRRRTSGRPPPGSAAAPRPPRPVRQPRPPGAARTAPDGARPCRACAPRSMCRPRTRPTGTSLVRGDPTTSGSPPPWPARMPPGSGARAPPARAVHHRLQRHPERRVVPGARQVQRAAHHRRTDHLAVVERIVEVLAGERLQPRPQPDERRLRLLRLRTRQPLHRLDDGDPLPRQQHLARQRRAIELPAAQRGRLHAASLARPSPSRQSSGDHRLVASLQVVRDAEADRGVHRQGLDLVRRKEPDLEGLVGPVEDPPAGHVAREADRELLAHLADDCLGDARADLHRPARDRPELVVAATVQQDPPFASTTTVDAPGTSEFARGESGSSS